MEQTTQKPTNMETSINELEVNGVKYVRRDSASAPALNSENAVIVRCARAGVFFGYLEDVDLAKGVAKLRQARRLWYWSGAASLSQMAVDGTSKPKECKFPTPVSLIQVTEVLEVIPCTQKAVDSINSVATWKA